MRVETLGVTAALGKVEVILTVFSKISSTA